MILRPYQSSASDAIFKEWQENDSTLVVMPTGGGKTILFADVIRRVFPRRALVNAHREELVFQARDKNQRVTVLEDLFRSLPKSRAEGRRTIVYTIADVGNDPWPYGTTRVPSLLFADVQFSGV